MPQLSEVNIRHVNWHEAENLLREVRTQVFIQEQHVPIDLEWDGMDESASHLLAMFENQPIACARIVDYKIIGRMAVLKNWRGMGLGTALLLEAIQICKQQGAIIITLSAQTHAIGFYRQAGFKVVSGEYLDANMPHVDMQLALAD